MAIRINAIVIDGVTDALGCPAPGIAVGSSTIVVSRVADRLTGLVPGGSRAGVVPIGEGGVTNLLDAVGISAIVLASADVTCASAEG